MESIRRILEFFESIFFPRSDYSLEILIALLILWLLAISIGVVFSPLFSRRRPPIGIRMEISFSVVFSCLIYATLLIALVLTNIVRLKIGSISPFGLTALIPYGTLAFLSLFLAFFHYSRIKDRIDMEGKK